MWRGCRRRNRAGCSATPPGPGSAPGPASRQAPTRQGGRSQMSDLQALADRVEIEALRGAYTDAVLMRDYDRVASLFTPDGALRMPNAPAELTSPEEIRAFGQRVPAFVDYLVQTTHPGTIQLD